MTVPAATSSQLSDNEHLKDNSQYVLWLVYINVALYALCFQIQRPLEPFLVEKLLKTGDGAQEYAKLQSFFSLIQTFGSVISGRLLDRFGAKGGFLVNFAACALSYGLLSRATTLPILYASKIPTVFQAGFLCAQLTASQVTQDGPDRVRALGLLTTSYTVGAIMGPSIGGFLGASGDYYLGARMAVVGSLLSFVTILFMPNKFIINSVTSSESTAEIPSDQKDPSTSTKESPPVSAEALPSYYSVIRVVWLLLTTKVVTSVANAMVITAFPIVLKNQYGQNEQGLGLAMSISSACNAVVSGLFLEPIVKRMGEDLIQVISSCLTIMMIFSLLQGIVTIDIITAYSPGGGLYQYIGIGLLLSVFQFILATTITSESTTRVGSKAKGTLLGLEHSLFAAARIIAPQMGIGLLEWGGISTVCIASAAIFGTIRLVWNTYSAYGIENKDLRSERKEK